MKTQILFRGIKSSNILKEYTLQRLSLQVFRFTEGLHHARIIFSAVGNQKMATCHLYGRDGLFLGAAEHSRDIYEATDKVIETLRHRLKRRNARIKSFLYQKKRRPKIERVVA